MSPLLLLAAALPANAGIELGGVIAIQQSEGVDADAAAALLTPALVEGCVSGGISYARLDARVTVGPEGTPQVAWEQDGLTTKLARIQTCLDNALQEALPPILTDPSAGLTLEVGYGPLENGKLKPKAGGGDGESRPQDEQITPDQAAAGLAIETSRTDGIDGPALATAVLAQRAALGACYGGPSDGGKVSLNVDWTKKEQYAKLVGYTSGMEDTGKCVHGVLMGIPLRDADGAKKNGRGSLELSYEPPA
jgi:hypothetical protein